MSVLIAFVWANALTIISWVIRIGALILVPFRRSPAAARGWLLLFFIAPLPALLLFLILGSSQHPKRRRKLFEKLPDILRRSVADAGIATGEARAQLPSNVEPISALASGLAGLPPVAGNEIELLEDYGNAIDALVTEIDRAEHHVHLQYYIFADDATGRKIAEAVERACKRGVTCRVLIDALGSLKWSKAVLARLHAAGIEAHRILPLGMRRNASRLDLRNHRKIAVIDGHVGFTGSQNIVNAQPSPGSPSNVELVIRVTGPVVSELQAVFLGDWYLESGAVLEGDKIFSPASAEGSISAQFVPSGPDYPIGGIDLLFVAAMNLAREEIVIVTPYFIPNGALISAMTSAALRGVKVRIMVSRYLDGYLVGFAQRSYYAELLRSGVEIHLYESGFVHAKHMRIDRNLSVIGSCNMDERSFRLNAEASMLCYGPEIADRVASVEQRYFDSATQLEKGEWAQRSLITKALENSARLLSDLL
ncbi:cardiolipin synthase [Parasphingopyxis sp. CP4]|uniref:cardiolipin synthase n=1 Tax=Parasphingopyxis sp. CP4 TaxID=2724527 RepID=UPI0015A48218|nr:cardiolipin synthase [Parasphingopyxis sp. CP4]QLC21662.1 cardiolipin synthase [Parasphingopyxis sp. CP4]